ncbi:MAG TPA: N-acetylmuramoyl-L-alanine amidase [Gaiellaceae bacterium]
MTPIRAALVLFFATPGVAWASPSLVARELPLQSGTVASAPQPFELVGLHWRGSGTIRFRTESKTGRWSGWQLSAPENDLPDRNTAEARRSRGWHLGNPFWVGASQRIQYRFSGALHSLRAYFVTAPPAPRVTPPAEQFSANSPPIITRAQWGANEQIRRDRTARYADEVHLAIVHHTAGSNSYSRSESASIVRAIEIYHVLGNGWDDIGYNFLVDKYGQVFEGRYGGIDRPVVGAHAMGFNHGSVGVALIGDYNGVGLTAPERAALVKLLAWRLDVSHVDPLSQVSRVSTGNPRYSQGTPVLLRAISGHRDVSPTNCPGNDVYAELPAIAREVAATGLPKIYSPLVFGAIGGNVRFTARLSNAVPWTVTVSDSLGHIVASGTGVGQSIDWTWDASAVSQGLYTYTIAASAGAVAARPVVGTVGRSLPQLSLTRVRVQPSVISPNGAAVNGNATISYALGAPAALTVTLSDAAGNKLATLYSGVMNQGLHSLAWRQISVPDGRYSITIQAQGSNGKTVSSSTSFYVDRTLAAVALAPAAISPNGDGRFDQALLSFRLTAAASVRVELLRGRRALTALVNQPFAPGPAQVAWNGKIGPSVARDGVYSLLVQATDSLTTVSRRLRITVDTTPPRLRLVSRRRLLFWTSEAASVSARFGARSLTTQVRRGYFGFPSLGGDSHFSLVATDAAGNVSRPLRG